MRTPDARHRALLRVLVEHELRFVLIGGVALQLRGYSAATRDVDITIATDPTNVRRVDSALSALNARPYLPGKRGSAYRTDHGQLEVIRTTSGVGDYTAWSRNATQLEITPGLTVNVGSASDLLLAKEHAARPKDLDVLPRARAELLAAGALDPADERGPVAEPETPIVPAARYEQLLGPRPATRRGRGLWDHAAAVIADYRTRWKITDDQPLLGAPPPHASKQAKDRASVDRQLHRLKRLAERDREPPSVGR